MNEKQLDQEDFMEKAGEMNGEPDPNAEVPKLSFADLVPKEGELAGVQAETIELRGIKRKVWIVKVDIFHRIMDYEGMADDPDDPMLNLDITGLNPDQIREAYADMFDNLDRDGKIAVRKKGAETENDILKKYIYDPRILDDDDPALEAEHADGIDRIPLSMVPQDLREALVAAHNRVNNDEVEAVAIERFQEPGGDAEVETGTDQ